jgi:hypothetical protein
LEDDDGEDNLSLTAIFQNVVEFYLRLGGFLWERSSLKQSMLGKEET